MHNPWGVFDVYGSVWEWCSDFYGETWYQKSPVLDPRGPGSGKGHVIRGGGWNYEAINCRSAYRGSQREEIRLDNVGFRVCFIPQPAK
jgi:formylglycine-generating enzyme required for sulfatase activity